MIAGYQSMKLLPDWELQAHLGYFRQFRGAVQAVYFSRRLHENDLTGIADHDENAKGLRDARRILQDAGVRLRDD